MERGVFWACAQCGGRALSVELLRHNFSNDAVNSFWSRVVGEVGRPGRGCPCCGRQMTEVALADTPEASRIDVCRGCHFVWFDAGEIAELPPLDLSTAPSPEARKALAYVEIQRLARAAEGRDLDGAKLDAWWKIVIRAFGYIIQ